MISCQFKESMNIQLWRGLKNHLSTFLQQKEWYSRQPGRTSIIREPSYGTNERKYLHGSPVKPFFYIIKAYLVQCAWSCTEQYNSRIKHLSILTIFPSSLWLTIENYHLYKQDCRRRVGRGVQVGKCPSVLGRLVNPISIPTRLKRLWPSHYDVPPGISKPSYGPKVHYLTRVINSWRKNDFTKDDLKSFFICPEKQRPKNGKCLVLCRKYKGTVHKLRLQEEGVGGPTMSTFCQRS